MTRTNRMRDLGVLTTTNLKYSEHVSDIVNRASRRANWILRSFVVNNPALYMRLYECYVMPIITYASPVWNTGLVKDKKLLQRAQKRFLRRVAYRCKVGIDEILCKDILEVLCANDLCTLKRLKKFPSLFDEFFNTVSTVTRSGLSLQPKETASKTSVNNAFAWRVSRLNRAWTQSQLRCLLCLCLWNQIKCLCIVLCIQFS